MRPNDMACAIDRLGIWIHFKNNDSTFYGFFLVVRRSTKKSNEMNFISRIANK